MERRGGRPYGAGGCVVEEGTIGKGSMRFRNDRTRSLFGATYPSSIVSSRARRTRSRFSRSARFSTWFRRSMEMASVNALKADYGEAREMSIMLDISRYMVYKHEA
jgi:hypothetical protein